MFGVTETVSERVCKTSHKHRSNEAPEVCSNTTEGEAKVHTLAEHRVHPPTHPSLKVFFKNVKKLPDL